MRRSRFMSAIRRIIYRLGFRPKRGNPLHNLSLDLIYKWRDRGGLLSQPKLSIPPLDTPKLVDKITAARYAKMVPSYEQTFYIFPTQVSTLVAMDKEGRSYDQWVEELTNHGWTVVKPEEML